MAGRIRAKPLILAVSSVVITVTGAMLGAQLKTEHQASQQVEQMREASPAEKIEILEQTKEKFVAQKRTLEEKIERLHARQTKEEATKMERIKQEHPQLP